MAKSGVVVNLFRLAVPFIIGIMVGALACTYYLKQPQTTSKNENVILPLRVSVPPYVDTAMTVIGVQTGQFAARGIDVKLIDTTWENQYELLVGGALDVSMSTLDEFVNKNRNLRAAGKPILYVLPAWQFRGLAFYSAGGIQSLSDIQKQLPLEQAKKKFLAQILKRKIVLPEGSVFEQALRAFVSENKVDFNNLKIVNASLDSALNSLGDKSVGLVAVGSQQRFEAERRGYHEAISPEDLGLDVITGFVVPENIWNTRKQDIINFGCVWYEITRKATAQKKEAYEITNNYLVGRGSNSLTEQEYMSLRAYNVLPQTPREAATLFFDSNGKAFWKKTWDRSVKSMTDADKSDQAPINASDFIAPQINNILEMQCNHG